MTTRVIILCALLVAGLMACSPAAQAADPGLVTLRSSVDFEATLSRLTAALEKRGLTLFSQIDHAKGAHSIGATLRPTTLVLFGSPKVGTPVMQARQRAGLDLPMRMLVYVGEDGATYLAYRSPDALVSDHDLDPVPVTVGKMKNGLTGIAQEVAQAD